MRASVLIPTRDHPSLLADCLASLGEQDPPRGGWEVIVIDDGSESSLASIVAEAAAAGLPARCLRQDPAGLNAARNTGINASTGEIVAFLDDDTLVEPGWIRAIDRAFEDGWDAVGGRVVLKLEGTDELPRWITEKRLSYLSRYDLGPSPRQVHGRPSPVGANLALRRAALDSLGGFRAGLDRIGEALLSNGELELLNRLLAAGGRAVYWPDATVVHRVPAERLTKEWFRQRAHAQGVSDIQTEPVEGTSYPIRVAREVARGGRAVPILARRLLEGHGAFDAELWLISCRARLQELKRQRGERLRQQRALPSHAEDSAQ